MLVFYSDGGYKENKSIDTQLLSEVGKKARISYLSVDPSGDFPWFQKWKQDRKMAGFKEVHFFALSKQTTKAEVIEGLASEVLFLPGGNTFQILDKIKKLNFFNKIKKFYQQGRVVSGLSAGAMIMTPTIRIAELVGDEPVMSNYNLDGLNLVSFEVFPHYQNDNAQLKKLINYSKENHVTVFALTDGSGLVKKEQSLTIHNKVVCINKNNIIEITS